MADLSVHPSGNHQGTSRPTRNAGPEKHHVVELCQRCLTGAAAGLFLHWLRLPSPGICRDQVTSFEQQEVTAHDLGGSNHVGMPTAHHPGSRRCETRQRRDGSLGPILLEEPDHRVDEHNRQNGDTVDHLPECHRDERCADQHPNHQATKLPYEEHEGRNRLACAQCIGAPLLRPHCCLVGGKTTHFVCVQCGGELRERSVMPALWLVTLHGGFLLRWRPSRARG